MTADLFAPSDAMEELPIEQASVRYLPSCPLPQPPSALLGTLIAETPWRSETIRLFGKTHLQPRLIAWYADDGLAYSYSGSRLEALPWTDGLLAIRAAVEAACGVAFNSVLLNYYRDQRDSMGMHSDDEPELGRRPVIASLSLGETRRFVMKHRYRRDMAPVRIDLASGSLLVMAGDTQRYWKHGINKQATPCGPRVNLTFRNIIGPTASPATD